MTEKIEYEGVWWLPDRPNRHVRGTLKFTPDAGAVLDLVGSLRHISLTDRRDLDREFERDIILGTSVDGKSVTLYSCFELRSSGTAIGIESSSLHADSVFVGAHFEKPADIRFQELSTHYSHLDDWVDISGFHVEDAPDMKESFTRYRQPDPIEADINDEYKIIIDIRAGRSGLYPVKRKTTIEQKTYLKIQFPEARPLHEYWKPRCHLQNFLTLAVMAPVFPLDVQATTASGKSVTQQEEGSPTHIEMLEQPPYPAVPLRTLKPSDMLFSFHDISDKFEAYLQKWFARAELLQPVHDLYFGTLYNPHLYIEHTFLSLAQAAESYHRRAVGGLELPVEDYEKRLEGILEATPPTHRAWLKNKLRYSNEFTFRRRLKELFEANSDTLQEFISFRDYFLRKVVVTRNYLTHFDLKLKKEAAIGKELLPLTKQLRGLLTVCLLREVGFTTEELRELISRKRKYRSVWQLLG